MLTTLAWLAIALPAAQDTPPFAVSVSVDLVQLFATVRDRNGRFVHSLRENDFELFEDGIKQTIRLFAHEDIPITVGLVVDHSGSMKSKIAEVSAAARSFVRSSNSEDQMFVVNFNERVSLGLPTATPFTNHADKMEAALLNEPVTGMTALYDATLKGLEQVQSGDRSKRVLIVISDGGDNASKHTLNDVLQAAARSNTLIYTIGIFDASDPDRNPGVLRQLAAATGGEAFFPGELTKINSICEAIARDIRNQYSLGYSSHSTALPGAYRKIRVTARTAGSGKLQVRARAGYTSEPTKSAGLP